MKHCFLVGISIIWEKLNIEKIKRVNYEYIQKVYLLCKPYNFQLASTINNGNGSRGLFMQINTIKCFLILCLCSVYLIGCGGRVSLRKQFETAIPELTSSETYEMCSEYAESRVIRGKVTLDDIDTYKVGSYCHYLFNTSHLRIIQKRGAEGLALLCNPFGCNSEEIYHIILPHSITSDSIMLGPKYCAEITDGYTIIFSLNPKYSLRERKKMLEKKQKKLDEEYLNSVVTEYNYCYQVRTDWLLANSREDIKNYCWKYGGKGGDRLPDSKQIAISAACNKIFVK